MSQTLFCVHGSPTAVLVTTSDKGQMRSRARKFKDTGAAVAWCIKNQVNLCLSFAVADPAKN